MERDTGMLDVINPEVLKGLKDFGMAAFIAILFVWAASKFLMVFLQQTFQHGEKQQDIQHELLKEVTAMRETMTRLVDVVQGKLGKLDKHSDRLRAIEDKVSDIHKVVRYHHGDTDIKPRLIDNATLGQYQYRDE